MFRGIGWPEIILILVVVMLVFGAAKLPSIGRDLGRSIREFRRAAKGELTDDEKATPPPSATKPAATKEDKT